jgi:hypothetical protein
MGGSEQTQRGLRTTVLVLSGKFMPSLLPATAEAAGSSPVVPDIHSKRVTLISTKPSRTSCRVDFLALQRHLTTGATFHSLPAKTPRTRPLPEQRVWLA